MKRLVLLFLSTLIVLSIQCKAEDEELPPPKIVIRPSTGSGQGYRAPAVLPVEIVYNTETAVLRISSWGETEAEVYLLDANGVVENYSPTLACELTVPSSGVHTIYIQGEGWDASTEFEN